MEKINIHDANTHLSQLVERAEAGDAIVIARAGRLVAPLAPQAKPRKLGLLDGKCRIPDDFNATLPAGLLCAFRGSR